MYTAQQIFDLAMDLVNKRAANGIINATTTAVYKARTPGILTLWQNENAKSGDLYNIYEVSNKPITNMYGLLNGFDIQEFIGMDLIFEALGQAKAYYFEVDGPGTIYIEDYTNTWNVLATIIADNAITSFKAFKGVLNPTNGSTKTRIRFSGTYYYRTVNRALFSIPLAPDRIPDYRPWIKKVMPSDFKSIDHIIDEFPQRQYANDTTYKWEGRKDLYINYFYEGNVRIIYKPIPIQITDLSQTLQIDEITSMSGAYFLAAHLLLVEDPDTANFLNQRYEQLKLESNLKQPVSVQNIIDIYGFE
jgi:hypothetical protein